MNLTEAANKHMYEEEMDGVLHTKKGQIFELSNIKTIKQYLVDLSKSIDNKGDRWKLSEVLSFINDVEYVAMKTKDGK